MASNDIEVLDPAATVEKLKKITSEVALSRRRFLTGLGVAGVAAGTGLELGPVAHAQQPIPNGYQQVDVLNYLLNIKYLTATFYSYVTQGADLPGTTYATLGTGAVYNTPSRITTFTSQQNDLFNEMYYDDLNQVVDLRNLITGSLTPLTSPVVGRPTLSLGGQGNNTAAQTFTAAQAISQARMLEDVSVTAFTGALTYLTGANLALATQCLAISGMHASALRLISIQGTGGTPYPYQRTQIATTLQVGTQIGSSAVIAISTLSANILNGANILATGIPANTTIVSQSSKVSATFGAIATSGSNVLTAATSVTQVAIGQPLSPGGGIATNTVITNVGVTTVTMSANATSSSTATATGLTVSGSPILTSVSSIGSVVLGQIITGSGTGIPANTTITAVGSNTSGSTITMSNPATATSLTASLTGNLTSGSAVVTALGGPNTGLMLLGQPISGTGVQANTTIIGTSSLTITGIVATGSTTIAAVSSLAGVLVGQPISAGTGIPSGTTITAASGTTITISNKANGTSTSTLTGIVASGSASITGLANIGGQLVVGQPISGTGIPGSTTIKTIPNGPAIITLTASGTALNPITGQVTSGSANITAVSSLAGVAAGQVITSAQTGIQPGTTVVSFSGTAPNGTIVMSLPATATSIGVTLSSNANASSSITGFLTSGSTSITSASSISGVIFGQAISGPGIPAGTTVVSTSGTNIIIMSNAATATSAITVFGQITAGSSSITSALSLTGVTNGALITGTGIPPGTTVASSTGNTIVMSNFATATNLTAPSIVTTSTGIVTTGSTTLTAVSSLAGVTNGLLISGGGIPSGVTVVSSSGTTIVMSSAANGTTTATSVTPTGIVTSGSAMITGVSSLSGVLNNQSISGVGIPSGTVVVSSGGTSIFMSNAATASSTTAETLTITETLTFTQVGEPLIITAATTISGLPETITFNAPEIITVAPNALTMSLPATTTASNVALTTPGIVTFTFPTTETVTTGQSIITISQPATITASSTATVILTAPLDVAPADPGTPALAAAGPGPSPTLTPATNQGFFNTAGANNNSGTNPPGFAFARTFSQVLAALYANATPGIAKGGFYFVGVNGKIVVV